MVLQKSETPMKQIIPSTPGGVARQYRVQYRQQRARQWQLYGCYTSLESANACSSQLSNEGFAARVIHYAICPTA
ncbi:MAG: hypothetical protein ACI9G1_003588 [Pirellulaceae bacterium]|jgi:hypothetical protein